MWLVDGGVNGSRMLGQWPGPEERSFYEGLNLAVTTNFRSVLTWIAEPHLRLEGQIREKMFAEVQRVAKPVGVCVG